jgi:hypothetical protein
VPTKITPAFSNVILIGESVDASPIPSSIRSTVDIKISAFCARSFRSHPKSARAARACEAVTLQTFVLSFSNPNVAVLVPTGTRQTLRRGVGRELHRALRVGSAGNPLGALKNEKPACGLDPRCDDGINARANNVHQQSRGDNERKPKRWSRLARIQTKRRGSGNGDKGCRPHKCHARRRTPYRRRGRNTSTKIVVCARSKPLA